MAADWWRVASQFDRCLRNALRFEVGVPSPRRMWSAAMPDRELDRGWRMGPGRRRAILPRRVIVSATAGLAGDAARRVGVTGCAGEEIVRLRRSCADDRGVKDGV